MPRPGDRRPLIADSAIDVLADGGARALTHHAVDRAAGLAAGSTSYYFRTRDALVAAVIERIREHSRAAFDAALAPEPLTVATASVFIADQLHDLVAQRRPQALAVVALLPVASVDIEVREQLLDCLFSRELAHALAAELGVPSPEEVGDDLVDLLTGRLLGMLFRPRAEGIDGIRSVRDSVARIFESASPTAPH